jgi:hypothetical protein
VCVEVNIAKTDYKSGTKPRFDGSGSIFGDLHRELPPGVCMFDIDRLDINMALTIRRENEVFVEYHHENNGITFTALFEVKFKFNTKSLDKNNSLNLARLEMAKKLGCRLFVVFRTLGQLPLEFFEVNLNSGNASHVYTLTYDKNIDGAKISAISLCWKHLGLLK